MVNIKLESCLILFINFLLFTYHIVNIKLIYQFLIIRTCYIFTYHIVNIKRVIPCISVLK
ncbi:hypothetical protein FDC62_14070 [Clostridium botulinum]|nr:hypothetical protein [Clostridium botulinum]